MNTQDIPTWGSNGKRIPYNELTDDHLKNIIKDGYRNPHLQREAAIREMEYPEREVDKLLKDPADFMLLLESLYSSALAGNKVADKLLNLYEEQKIHEFYYHVNKLLEKRKEN